MNLLNSKFLKQMLLLKSNFMKNGILSEFKAVFYWIG